MIYKKEKKTEKLLGLIQIYDFGIKNGLCAQLTQKYLI